ncbi:MAG: hypothetical protein ACI88A_003288 [Paraglaciecola sp.]|jgi:hypothetical protein
MRKSSNFILANVGLWLAVLLGSGLIATNALAHKNTQEKSRSVWQSCQTLKSDSGLHTSKDDIAKSVCYQYIKGFMQGAVLSDGQIMRGLEQSQGLSNFSQRAIRTRVGNTRASDADTYLAKFCLPDADVDHVEVINVAIALTDQSVTQQQFASEVYTALKKAYPCADN